MKPFKISKSLYRPIIIILIALVCLGTNIRSFITHTLSTIQQRADLPYYEPGYQFLKFRPFLKNVKSIGYLNAKDLSRESNDGVYLQAQYFLAPSLIELTSERQFVILDVGLDIRQIVPAMQKLKGKRLTSTNYGQALIQRQ